MQGKDTIVPFDFVPFSNKPPVLKTVPDWEKEDGKLLSGVINYTLTSLTPIHIVGNKHEKNGQIQQYYFIKQNGTPIIPGTSVKGVIRSFFEALTNCWLGQVTPEYSADHGKRKVPFVAIPPQDSNSSTSPVIPERLHPIAVNGCVDLASFLFGYVPLNDSESKEDEAVKSRVIFNDIRLSNDKCNNNIMLPDVKGKAFMGGPKPRINNWWYFTPHAINKKLFRDHENVWFMGKHFRGRKFYYHHNPEHIYQCYLNDKRWKDKIYKYTVKTVDKQTNLTGQINFQSVPENILNLLLFSLCPGEYIKHKIGYGQAFGLGSIDIQIDNVEIDSLKDPFDLTRAAYSEEMMFENIQQYIDGNALDWLTKIISFDNNSKKFQLKYPPFYSKYFRTIVCADKVTELMGNNSITVSEKEAFEIAKRLYVGTKKTIHFRVYQEAQAEWDIIAKRIAQCFN